MKKAPRTYTTVSVRHDDGIPVIHKHTDPERFVAISMGDFTLTFNDAESLSNFRDALAFAATHFEVWICPDCKSEQYLGTEHVCDVDIQREWNDAMDQINDEGEVARSR